jgi:hypothetical protein
MAKYKLLGRDTTTGQVKHPESTVLNVVDYGAYTNGTNASATTTAITNAISDAMAAGGQSVYLPAGTYLVNSTINVPGGVTLYGDGADKSIISSATNQIILNLIEGSGAYATIGPKIRKLGILGSKTAGTNQIGIKADNGLYVAFVEVNNVRIINCGSHGLYVGKVFSSKFVEIFSSDHNGYPFLMDGDQMPSNHFESLYAGDLNTGFVSGFRIRKGNVTLITCNGINGSPTGSWWATVGDITSLESDGLSTDSTATLNLINCNIESSKAGGIRSYGNSRINFVGESTFVGDGSANGIYKPIQFNLNTTLYPYPAYLNAGNVPEELIFSNSYNQQVTGTVTINGTVNVVGVGTSFTTELVSGQLVTVSGQTRKVNTITDNTHFSTTSAFSGSASGQTMYRIYFAEGEIIHSNELPPVMLSGKGIRTADGVYRSKYYNTTTSRSEAIPRKDSFLNRETISSTSSYTYPGIRIYDLAAASDITLTLPWAGWSVMGETIYVINGSADGVNITLTSGGGGTVNGQSSININQKYQVLMLTANGNNYDVVNLTDTNRVDVKKYGARGDNSTNDTSAVSTAAAAAVTLGLPLYFPKGSYKIDTLALSNTNNIIIYGDGQNKSKLISRSGTSPVISFDSSSTYVHTVLIEKLSLVGFGSGSGNHGIQITGSLDPFNFTVREVTISNTGGDGINTTANLFAQLYEAVDISAVGGDGFNIKGNNDCTFIRCYVHTVGTSKSAYRVHSGTPTLIGCNGIDSGTTANWATFGDLTAEDGADRYVRATLIGCNIEDFTSIGARFKVGSFGTFIGTSIIAPASGTVKALQFDFVDSNSAGIFDAASSIQTKGAAWTSSGSVHSSGMPFVQIGHRALTQYYDTNVGALTNFPGMTGTLLAGTTDYALTFDGVVRAKDRLLFNEIASSATPPSNSVSLYAKDKAGTSALYFKNDAGTELEVGSASLANPSATIGLSAVNGSASSAMRSDAAPALSQAITPVWTGLHTFNPSTTPSNVLLLDIGALGTDGRRNSHNIVLRGRSRSGTQHTPEWKIYNNVTTDAGDSALTIGNQLDSGGYTDYFSLDSTGLLTVAAYQGDGGLLTNLDPSQFVGTYTSCTMTLSSGVLLGRSTASTGQVEEITIGSNLTLSGGVLSATGGGGGGITWNEVTGTTQSMSVDNGYIANNASLVTLTLPTTAAVGKIVRITGKGAGGWKIAQNASGIIHFGNLDTTTGTGGYLQSSDRRDSIELICVVANNEWNVISSIGNITVV